MFFFEDDINLLAEADNEDAGNEYSYQIGELEGASKNDSQGSNTMAQDSDNPSGDDNVTEENPENYDRGNEYDTGDETENMESGENNEESPYGTQQIQDDNRKRLILLQQYKELINIVNHVQGVLKKVRFENIDLNKECDYLNNRINEIDDKIHFLITKDFLTMDYLKLLELFYYFKFQIKDLSDLVKKLFFTKKQNNK